MCALVPAPLPAACAADLSPVGRGGRFRTWIWLTALSGTVGQSASRLELSTSARKSASIKGRPRDCR